MDQLTKIKTLIQPILEEENITLYDVSWQQEGRMRILQIAIMHTDGSMDIDTCVQMSEKISEILDEEDVITNEYFLEVCSPGAERELKDEQQIKDAIQEYVYVKLKDAKAGLDAVKGTLCAFEDGVIHMEYMDKAVKKKIAIEYANVALIRLSVKI